MKRRINPALLGSFVLVGLALAAALTITFGSGRLFSRRAPFVMVFPHSVNGLSVGAAVKFKGVPVGEVTRLSIRLDSKGNPADILAYAEFDENLIGSVAGKGGKSRRPFVISKAVENGLRARCASESFVTGQLYVDLDMYTNAPPPVFRFPGSPCPEIPVVNEGLVDFIRSLDRVNLAALSQKADQILTQLDRVLSEVKPSELNEALLETLQTIQELARDKDLHDAIRAFGQSADHTARLLERFQKDMPPITGNLTNTLAEMNRALRGFQETLGQVRAVTAPNAPIMRQIQQTLADFSDSAASLRGLLEELERNPNAWLTGKEIRQP